MSVRVYEGNCLDVLPRLDESSVHACVTDPPYHLASIVRRFGADDATPAKSNGTGVYTRSSRGFMGKRWDGGDVAFKPDTWAEVLRVLRPGAHVAAFGAPKTYHRLTCAIEDAGFEIRDSLAWLFATGFPKSHDPMRVHDKRVLGIDPAADPVDWAASRTHLAAYWDGWGTALKPGFEPIVLARKPIVGTLDRNMIQHGAGALNIAAVRHDGRWPATVLHDGSAEAMRPFPEDGPRVFYHAKADAADRLGSEHPTVKPTDLMAWLVRLITPAGGVVLDPFAGSGATAMAAMREGFDSIMIEADAGYVRDIERRVTHVRGDDLPLFGGNGA